MLDDSRVCLAVPTYKADSMTVRMKSMALVLALPLVLAACGGGGGGTDRDAIIDKAMADMTSGGDVTDAQKTCLTDFLKTLSDDELGAISSEEAPAQEIQDKITTGLVNCATAQ